MPSGWQTFYSFHKYSVILNCLPYNKICFEIELELMVLVRNFIKYHLPLLAYALLIFTVSAIPTLPHPDIGITGIDKIAHLIEYLVFFLIAVRAFSVRPFLFKNEKLIMLSGSISLIYAILDEIHQAFVPGRNADILDVLADLVGILCGVAIYYQWKKNKTETGNKRP